jgi:hypothetical protein
MGWTAGEPPPARLLIRRYCHLCEEMEAVVAPRLAAAGLSLERVDVDEDPALEERYGWDVPVLLHGGAVICRHRADPALLEAWLADLKP